MATVRPVQGSGARVQVSDRGGGQPVWSADGKRLFYRTGPAMMAADVAVAAKGGALSVSQREKLFEGAFFGDQIMPAAYDVAPDGRHFLMARALGEGAGEIVVMTGWLERLKAQMAARQK